MLSRTLIHIYGPFAIYTYGLVIALGVLITLHLIAKQPKRKQLISVDDLIETFTLGIFIGIIGGRLLHVASSYQQFDSILEIFALSQGGFSILGSILAIVLVMPWYLKRKGIVILPFLDLVATFAPLLQSISRIGCFFAGCCYGRPTDLPWAVIYTDPDTLAPLWCYMHPTQLYSSIILFGIFLFMYVVAQHRFKKPGQLLFLYLMLVSMERFLVDFWRDDREFFSSKALKLFSIHQWIALAMITTAAIGFYISSRRRKTT